ncbi:MAG: alpha-amylase family protein [Lachnospiraceae bacterium]|nr:alpha-amylase family protein [Lachnospiraceae bacterium]
MTDKKNIEDAVFKTRFARHYEELKSIYSRFYGEESPYFDELCGQMEKWASERSEDLKKLDREREASPDWYKDQNLLGMMMYTEQFADNLKGVKEHLDYVESCGVNYLHLMPLFDSPEGRSDGGYAVADFRKVRPDLGTMEDLSDLAAECRKRGISLCLDFVMNHTSEDHEWAKKARALDPEYMNRYFFYDSYDIPREFEKTVPQVFPTTAPGNFTWLPEIQKYVMTTFYPYQWDLNYANPVVFNEMVNNIMYLANNGIDVFRIDAVPYIWKQLGTDCRNLPEVHDLVRMIRMLCEIVCPGVILLGEVVMEPIKVVPYFGSVEKPECHMLYNVTTMCTTWHTVATRDVRLLRRQLDTISTLPREYMFLNYLRCHDDIGWGLDYDFLRNFGIQEVPHKKYLNDFFTGNIPYSFAEGELYNSDPRLGDARLCGTTASLCGIEYASYRCEKDMLNKAIGFDLMLHAFMLTQSGLPIIYSGDEVCRLNDYTYKNDPNKAEDSRYLHRGKFLWNDAADRENQDTVAGRFFSVLKKLEDVRKTEELFASDAQMWTIDTWDDAILGIVKEKNGKKLIALFNFSEYDKTAWIDEGFVPYVNLMDGEKIVPRGVNLPAYGFMWLKGC